jgi:hypothetical protein
MGCTDRGLTGPQLDLSACFPDFLYLVLEARISSSDDPTATSRGVVFCDVSNADWSYRPGSGDAEVALHEPSEVSEGV